MRNRVATSPFAMLRLTLVCFITLFASVRVGFGQSAAPIGDETDELVVPGPTERGADDPSVGAFWKALEHFRSTKPDDLAAGREALQTSADLEFTHAQVLLANSLVSGAYGFTKNARKAANLFELAAERGNAYAMVSLGECLLTGTGVRRNSGKAEAWLKRALAPEADYSRPVPPATSPLATAAVPGLAGEMVRDAAAITRAVAHYLLGQLLAKRNDAAGAHLHYVAAARTGENGQEGIQQAAVQAAFNYAFGLGTPRDLTKANELLEQSKRLIARTSAAMIHAEVARKRVDEFAAADLEESALSESEALQQRLRLLIAGTLADKKSKDYNLAEAVKWYELAAENDQAWAMIALAFIYARGELGAPDPVKAFTWLERAGGGDRPKHTLASANLGLCYLHGFGTAPDPERAREIFLRFRKHHILAYLGSEGRAPAQLQDFEQCMDLLETAAKKEPHAQFLMGRRHLEAWDGEQDIDEAVRWFRRAVKARHPTAMVYLGWLHEAQPWLFNLERDKANAQAAKFYQDAAAQNDPQALASLGLCLLQGTGTPKSLVLAERAYLKSLELDPDNADAHNNLGVVYLNQAIEDGSSESRRDMLKHFEKAAELDHALAASNLGQLYFEGKLVLPDPRKAYVYFNQAADLGYTTVHYQLGLMHEQGRGVPVTPSEAAYHYRMAALEGHREALQRLAQFYLTGKGVSMDLDRAGFWLSRLAQAGNTGGLLALVDIALTRERYAEALPMLRRLSRNANETVSGFAFDRLSRCYQLGLGVKPDAARAQRYFDEAVKRGHADALTHLALKQIGEGRTEEAVAHLHAAARASGEAAFYLGQMYFFGTYVSKDQSRAFEYMRRSADRGYAKALYFLAAATYKGVPGAPSRADALRLAEQAEGLGLKEATALREELEKGASAPATDETGGRARSI